MLKGKVDGAVRAEYNRFWGQEHVAELIVGSHLKNVQLLAKGRKCERTFQTEGIV